MAYSPDPNRVDQRTTAQVKTPPSGSNSLYPKSDNRWYTKDSTGTERAVDQTAIEIAAPPGIFVPYGGLAAPTGWLLCDGTFKSQATFAALFTAIGHRFNGGVDPGDGTFKVPTTADLFVIGASGTKAVGATGGSATKTLTTANLAAHDHSINHDHADTTTDSDGTHAHVTERGGTLASGAFIARSDSNNVTNVGPMQTGGAHTHIVNTPTHTGNSGSSGSGTAFDVMNPWLAATFIIKT